MKRILCPTDFSDVANNAITYAAKLAHLHGAELILFNVHSLFDLSPAEIVRGKSQRVEKSKEVLERQALEVSREFRISCYGEVQLSGAPLSSLIAAQGNDFDLIVMGTNGPDDLYEFLSGSNTYNAIRKTRVPLLMVPEDVLYSEPSFIVFAFDYWRNGIPPINRVKDWMGKGHTELRMLELLELSQSPQQDEELITHQQLMRDQVAANINLTFDKIHTDNYPASIQSYMSDTGADMLVVSTHEYSIFEKLFHKSLTKALSTIARYPVLVLYQ